MKSLIDSGILSVRHSLWNTALLFSSRGDQRMERALLRLFKVYRESEIKSRSAKLPWERGAQRPILRVNEPKKTSAQRGQKAPVEYKNIVPEA
jgi:hypothetical protein